MEHGSTTRNVGGWTFVELIIAMGIVGILLTSALSGVSGAIQAARAVEARMALLASLNLARTEAALKGNDVGMCPSRDGENCEDRFDWQEGWVVFADLNGNNTRDSADLPITRQAGLGEGVRLLTSSGRTFIDFQPSGGNAGSNATFTVCDRRGPAKATAIAMGNGGTYRATKPSAAAAALACAQGAG